MADYSVDMAGCKGNPGSATAAGGVGAGFRLVAGVGGAKADTGAAAGGAGGDFVFTCGAGGATASAGTDAGGAGGTVTITCGAGGNATAGTGNGGAGGNFVVNAGSGGTSAGGTAGANGIVALGDAGTKTVYLNRAGLAATHQGLTLTALGTAQSSSPTAAQLLGGFLTQTSATGAGAVTLPTGSALSAACARTPATGDSFECIFANLGGSQTLTITGATGTTVVSGGAVATAKTAILKFICTGSNAWSIAVAGG